MISIRDTNPDNNGVYGKYDDPTRCTVSAQFDSGRYMTKFYIHHKHLQPIIHPKATDAVWDELELLIANVVDGYLTAKFGE